MKNITFSADENLIEQARDKARSENTTLNEAFREWLRSYIEVSSRGERFDRLMEDLKHIKAPRHFTRDEMNER